MSVKNEARERDEQPEMPIKDGVNPQEEPLPSEECEAYDEFVVAQQQERAWVRAFSSLLTTVPQIETDNKTLKVADDLMRIQVLERIGRIARNDICYRDHLEI